ncbi:MAG: TRIC cation channel family protein [Myxococcales bacterium]|nr:TRIC cation channel family protein [Myxococcales bacterium]
MIALLDFVGIFAFALSGVALAVRERLDIVGAVALATVTGLAGGIARDVLLGDMPRWPSAARDTCSSRSSPCC